MDDGGSLPLNRGQDDVQEIVHIGNGRDRLEAVDGHGFEAFSGVARFIRRGSKVAVDEEETRQKERKGRRCRWDDHLENVPSSFLALARRRPQTTSEGENLEIT